MVHGAELVVHDGGAGIEEVDVELSGLDAEDVVRRGVVAGEALVGARVLPGLNPRAGRGERAPTEPRTSFNEAWVMISILSFLSASTNLGTRMQMAQSLLG